VFVEAGAGDVAVDAPIEASTCPGMPPPGAICCGDIPCYGATCVTACPECGIKCTIGEICCAINNRGMCRRANVPCP
jgi:hypothetical protein